MRLPLICTAVVGCLALGAAIFTPLLPLQAAEGSGTPSEWSQFRGPDGQGVSSNKGLAVTWNASSNLLWKTELPGPGASSPILSGESIYLTCYSGYAVPGSSNGDLGSLQRHILCLSRTDGKLVWSKSIAAVQPEEARVRDHGYASSTPVADADRVYVFFGKSGVFAFNHAGEQLWKADVGSNTHGWGSAASPVLYKDFVIINAAVECGALFALNKTTGKQIWRAEGIKESWNTPILVPVENHDELVVAIAGKVLGFKPETGEELWSCATGIAWYMVPSLVNEKDVVYCIGGRSGGGLAVRAGGHGDVSSTRRLWTITKGSNVSSPILHQGYLYFLHESLGVAYCVEAKTGKVIYEERIERGGPFYASPVLADEKLYCVSRRGQVYVLAAKPQYQLLARNDLADRSSFDASAAVDGARLLVRSDRFLYCIGEK